METPLETGELHPRRRRAHKKSRRGCSNCKLRRVKCDETRPKCKQCTSYGVSCNYDSNIQDLQMEFSGVAMPSDNAVIAQSKPENRLQIQEFSPPRTVVSTCLNTAILSDHNLDLPLDKQCADRFVRFQMRTILSISGNTEICWIYQAVTTKLAYSNVYLMHVVQALTAIHDRYLTGPENWRRSLPEVYHLSRAATSFNKMLCRPIQPEDRDALWGTAALLILVAMSSIEASNPEEAWPLRESDPSDLEWLKMADSKEVVWKLTNPWRLDSLFHAIGNLYKRNGPELSAMASSVDGVLSVFLQLCNLKDPYTAKDNPYRAAVFTLIPMIEIKCTLKNLLDFFPFTYHMQPDFKVLLEQKDPRALLLLAYWYAKVRPAVWWVERRSTLEGQAICMYLDRYHADEIVIQELLHFPKIHLGLS